jgi:hypothetical protein
MSTGRHNPWISIADLFSSFSAVLLLMFIVVVTINAARARSARQRLRRDAGIADAQASVEGGLGEVNPERAHDRFMERLRDSLQTDSDLVRVDVARRLIIVRAGSFAEREACLRVQANQAFRRIAGTICDELLAEGRLEIHIEGHADPRAFPSQHAGDTRCGAFSNNTELSSARASQVREVIADTCRARCPPPGTGERAVGRVGVGGASFCDGAESARPISPEVVHLRTLRRDLCARLPVTGFGGSRPVNLIDPAAEENRRVELHLLWGASDASEPVRCGP